MAQVMKHTSLVYHLCGVKVAQVSPDDRGAPSDSLPPKLIIPPGVYNYRGESYNLAQEGLYRLMCPPEDNQQRIVYHHDVFALMSAVGWLHCHGSRDDYKSFDEVIALALTNKLVLTCGPYTKIVTTLFTQLGIPIRTVCVKTLEDRNGYSDGHVLSEIRLDGRWVVFDVDPHMLYSFGGKRLSLLDLNPHVQAGDYVREPLTNTVSFAITDFKNKEGTYDYGLWYETVIAMQDGSEFRRVMMIPIIPADGQSYYTTYTEAQHQRAETLWSGAGLRYLPIADFRARFYPGEASCAGT